MDPHPADQRDGELLDAVRRRDLTGLRSLYERHGGVVHRCAVLVAARAAVGDADQLTVDAFRNLWLDPPAADDGGSVLTHLLRLVGRAGRPERVLTA
jgi:DNA-directed RNA polymerase specialized sigma24 family protein